MVTFGSKSGSLKKVFGGKGCYELEIQKVGYHPLESPIYRIHPFIYTLLFLLPNCCYRSDFLLAPICGHLLAF